MTIGLERVFEISNFYRAENSHTGRHLTEFTSIDIEAAFMDYNDVMDVLEALVIAMALILKPQFVVADEPTTALDVLIQAQIINLLKKLKKDGMSFMLITHDLAVLSEIADKIGIMYLSLIHI